MTTTFVGVGVVVGTGVAVGFCVAANVTLKLGFPGASEDPVALPNGQLTLLSISAAIASLDGQIKLLPTDSWSVCVVTSASLPSLHGHKTPK